MRRLSCPALCCLLLLSLPGVGAAQKHPVAAVRARVTAPAWFARPLVGQGRLVPGDSLELRLGEAPGARVLLPLRGVQVEMSLGRNRVQWVVGAAAGALAGGVLGGVAGGRHDPSGFGAYLGLVGGAFVGVLAGAGAGVALAPERWVPWRAR